jgi:hypothetical protein
MIIVSAISSFPRKRESRSSLVDSRFRGNDVDVWVAEFMIKAKYTIMSSILCFAKIGCLMLDAGYWNASYQHPASRHSF